MQSQNFQQCYLKCFLSLYLILFPGPWAWEQDHTSVTIGGQTFEVSFVVSFAFPVHVCVMYYKNSREFIFDMVSSVPGKIGQRHGRS